MSKYLLAASPLPGHADPVIAAAAALAARGHDVLVHTGTLFRGAAERAGAAFVPLAAEIDFDYRGFSTRFPERAALPPGPAQMLWGIRHIFADAIVAQARGLCGILESFTADAILADMLFLGTLPLLLGPRAARPVVAHLGISSLALSGPDVAFFGAGLPPARTQQQRARNEAVTTYMHNQVFGGVHGYINEVLAACGAPKLPCFVSDAVVLLPDAYLQLGLPALEYDRVLQPSVHFIGALPVPAPAGYQPPVWWPEVLAARAAGRKIVLVTQGTIASEDLFQLVIPALAALDGTDMLVIAVTSGADASHVKACAPANARITPFIPYDFALRHTDLLITNGGFGGVLLALRHGVPLIIAGDSEEKPEIAGRIAAAGAAIDLATGQPEPELLADAVHDIFVSPAYRERAKTLAAHLAGLDTIGLIEQALSGGAAKRAA